MRRTVMLLGVAVVMLVVAAGVAVAVTKTCKDIPCRGTNEDDVLHERRDKDRILGLDGEDRIEAVTYNNDRDRLKGGQKGDRLLTSDGDGRDAANGGRGRDSCLVDTGDARSSCERLEVATTDADLQGADVEAQSWSNSGP